MCSIANVSEFVSQVDNIIHLGDHDDDHPKILVAFFTGTSTFFLLAVIFSCIKQFIKNGKVRNFRLSVEIERGKISWAKIPSIPSLPIIGILYHVLRPGVDLFQVATDLCSKHLKTGLCKGTIFFDRYVILLDPNYIQKALLATDAAYLNKPSIYKWIWGSDGLVWSEYPVWHKHRKIISRLFNYNGVQHQLRKLNLHTETMIKEIFQKCDTEAGENLNSNTKINISSMLHHTIFKNILDVIMDTEVATTEERQELHKNMMTTLKGISRQMREPWLLIKPIYWLHPFSRVMNHAEINVRMFIKFMCEKYISEREQRQNQNIDFNDEETETSRGNCLIGALLDAGLSENDIYHETQTVALAGHETSSSSATCLLQRLAENREIQEKCRNEVDQLFQRKLKNLGTCEDRQTLTMADLGSLEYLDRCVKENLRLTPIIPVFARRLEAPLNISDDICLDSGVNVVLCPWVVHRNPEYFPEPEKFNPDRFLPEECKMRHPYAYIPFSGGVRNCIGWKNALLTIKLITANILRNYELEHVQKWEELEFLVGVTVTTKEDIYLKLTRRQL